MAVANFIQSGFSIDYTPSSDVAAGDVVIVNGRCYVANQPITANTPGSLCSAGVFDVAKTSSLTVSFGDEVFFNTTTLAITKTPSDVYFGVCVAASSSSATTVRCVLQQERSGPGVTTQTDAAETVTLSALKSGKVILPNTAARTYTLATPTANDVIECTFVKSTATSFPT